MEPLADKTTMRVGGPAHRFVSVPDKHALRAACAEARALSAPLFLLGGGSNLVVCDEGLNACVVSLGLTEVILKPDGPAHCVVQAEAGVAFDALVERCVNEGLWGLECLSGIPGTVGAAPVQNIGAYGQSLSDTLQAVYLLPTDGNDGAWVPASTLRLGYRTSALKSTRPQSIVCAVRLRLRRDKAPHAHSRADALGCSDARHPSAVRERVLSIRRGKGMLWTGDDNPFGTVGSFFLNPVVPQHAAAAIIAAHDEVPTYPAAGGVKLAAAWLIEQAGLVRGHLFRVSANRVGLSPHHALSIINRGGATAADIVAAASEIRLRVYDRFGVMLEPEARFVGFPESGPKLLFEQG